MNPLTAHLERYQKQPPLIKDDDDGAGVRKRPFSNCVLFVLLAVFVFFLACLAVYTAVAMGIPVEKNEAAPLKSELSSSKAQVLPDSMIDKTPPKEPSKNVTNKTGNDSVIVSNPSRLRIQIFIKGKEAEDSKEHSDSEQNKTEESILNTIPKNRIFLRRIIIHKNGLNKPEIDSSEEVSSGSDENIKEVLGFKPFGIGNAPNPLDIFFNLLKLSEAPFGNIFNSLEKQKNKELNTPAIEFPEKTAKNEKTTAIEDPLMIPLSNIFNALEKQKNKESNTPTIEFPEKTAKNEKTTAIEDQMEEEFNSVVKQKNESKSNQSEQNEKTSQVKPNETKSEKPESSPIEDEKLNPANLVNDAQRMISSIEQKQRYNENMTPIVPQAVRAPVIRFFRFISPDHPHVQRPETYSPAYQRNVFQHPNPYSQSMTRLPYSHENIANRGSFSGEHDRMGEVRYKTPSTMLPSTQTTIPPETYSTTPSGYSMPFDKNAYRGHYGEPINHHHKETQNQMTSASNKQEQPGMIDRINTENIKPFEDFFKYRNL
ncbi:uncharacterized protein [Halyomorpha halys]|uniref:uncharacterized protein n=1 Tax=Halyomorpha halys TaxID=286706 RepID=UPI0006D51B82|nr:uncharacterized protein LOC106690614 [Halyomorpha halys]